MSTTTPTTTFRPDRADRIALATDVRDADQWEIGQTRTVKLIAAGAVLAVIGGRLWIAGV